MSTSVKIVLPDTGPLITLAHAGALDVLLAFDPTRVQLVVTDMVEFEATRRRSTHKDAQDIADFISKNAGRIVIEQTSFGRMAISAALTYDKYIDSQAVRDFYAAAQMPPPAPVSPNSGELSINSYVTELIGQPPGPPCLLIAEDDFFLRSTSGALPGNAHIISTATLLAEIEKLNPRFKARDILEAARQYKDRNPNRVQVDLSAAKIKDGTTWADTLDPAKLAIRVPKRARSKKQG